MMNPYGAVVLFSGGIDSTVVLAHALRLMEHVVLLTVDYGNRQKAELIAADNILSYYQSFHAQKGGKKKIEAKTIKLDMTQWGGSALTDPTIAVPDEEPGTEGSPVYVPHRNAILLIVAASVAEAYCCQTVFIGTNEQDYVGADGKPEFHDAMNLMLTWASRAADEFTPVQVQAPLINKNKAAVIRYGQQLRAPLDLTWSCYNPQLVDDHYKPCRRCATCRQRAAAFSELAIEDPLIPVPCGCK